MIRLAICRTWDGQPADPGEHAAVDLRLVDGGLVLRVEAPDHGDPRPAGPPGPTPGLWEHEVVELFLCGPGERYLEVELGPGGHHLVLLLDGVRQVTDQAMPLDVRWSRTPGRWAAETVLPAAWLPPRPWRANAYAIHGTGPTRRYLACHPVPGLAPDFHQPGAFPPLPHEAP